MAFASAADRRSAGAAAAAREVGQVAATPAMACDPFGHLWRVPVQSGDEACRSRSRVEAVAGVNLPMLVRAFTYRKKGMDTIVKKAITGGCDGVVRVEVHPVHAATRNRDS